PAGGTGRLRWLGSPLLSVPGDVRDGELSSQAQIVIGRADEGPQRALVDLAGFCGASRLLCRIADIQHGGSRQLHECRVALAPASSHLRQHRRRTARGISKVLRAAWPRLLRQEFGERLTHLGYQAILGLATPALDNLLLALALGFALDACHCLLVTGAY